MRNIWYWKCPIFVCILTWIPSCVSAYWPEYLPVLYQTCTTAPLWITHFPVCLFVFDNMTENLSTDFDEIFCWIWYSKEQLKNIKGDICELVKVGRIRHSLYQTCLFYSKSTVRGNMVVLPLMLKSLSKSANWFDQFIIARITVNGF